MTREWWSSRDAFDLYVSELVIDEAAAGDPAAAAQRLETLRALPLPGMTPDAESLARDLVGQAVLPQTAGIAALHIALATVHGMDYLLPWNCSHIANATMRGRIEEVCRAAGFEPPIICTPMELLEE